MRRRAALAVLLLLAVSLALSDTRVEPPPGESTAAASQIVVVMPGQTFTPGVGLLGVPDPVTLRDPIRVIVYAVDAGANVASSPEIAIELATDEPVPAPAVRLPSAVSGTGAATSLTNGSLRLSVNGSAYREIDLGSPPAPQDICMAIENGVKPPPQLEFQWGGSLEFRCLITSLSQRYTLFADDGVPVRAKVDLTLAQQIQRLGSLSVDPAFGSAPILKLGAPTPLADPNAPDEHLARSVSPPVAGDNETSRGFAAFTAYYTDPNAVGPGHTLTVIQAGGPPLPVVQDPFTVNANQLEVVSVVLRDSAGSGGIDRAEISFNDLVDPGSIPGNESDFQLSLLDPNSPPVVVSGVSGTYQVIGDSPRVASRLDLTLDGTLPTTSRNNIVFTAAGGGIMSAGGGPLQAVSFDVSSPGLVDGAGPVLLASTPLDTDSDGSYDLVRLVFSEEIHFSPGHGISVSAVHSGDPNGFSIPSGSLLRFQATDPVAGVVDRTVVLVDPDDPNAPFITGAGRIALVIQHAILSSGDEKHVVHTTVDFDAESRRYVLRSGRPGAGQSVQILPAGAGVDAGPLLLLGDPGPNVGQEKPGFEEGQVDLSDIFVLSHDGKTNLMAGASSSSVTLLSNAIEFQLTLPVLQSAGEPLVAIADNFDCGAVSGSGSECEVPDALCLNLTAGASVGYCGRDPSRSRLLVVVDSTDSDPNDLDLHVNPGPFPLDASPSLYPLSAADGPSIAGFRWRQVAGPAPLFLTDPNSPVTTASGTVPGVYTMEAVAQVQPPDPIVVNRLTDSDGAIRLPFTVTVLCTSDLQCDDGDSCNGPESCQLSTGTCLPAPAPPVDVCDGIDNDCDGVTDEGQAETCNGVDDDCDGLIQPGDEDIDGDGVPACAGDCNDGDGQAVALGASVEVLDVADVSPGVYRFTLDDQSPAVGSSVLYDAVRVTQAQTTVARDQYPLAVCVLEDLGTLPVEWDYSGPLPFPGEAFLFAFRAHTSCGSTGYGDPNRTALIEGSPTACKLAGGVQCTSGAECPTGFCVDGVCCDTSCSSECERCDAPGSAGLCLPVPDGTVDPACLEFTCSAGQCRISCASDAHCDPAFHCDTLSSACLPDLPQGQSCSADSQCLSGYCTDGFCCAEPCSGTCQSCNRPALEGTCSADPFGSGPSEICDGADNDCDGLTDEGFGIGLACTGNGECQAGIIECDGTGSTRCSSEPGGSSDQSAPEICDGLDNDCDGATDGFPTACGTGACTAAGSCAGGGDSCVPLPPPGPETCGDGIDNDCDGATDAADADCSAPELCDGVDNDLDGLVDEDFGVGQSCTGAGACGGGVVECASAVAARCSTDPGGSQDGSGAELCDGADNDCDGTTDEACTCQDGETRACGTDAGECASGLTSCTYTQGGWGACVGAVDPAPELCDGLDNDCDGLTDEGLAGEACLGVGACRGGVTECDGLGGTRCSSMPGGSADASSPETCDGLDNDCDGLTDEACPCTPGESQPCGDALGSCSRGVQVCDGTGAWGSCQGGSGPGLESCDGIDNDCDGLTDEEDLAGAAASCGVGECLAPAACTGGGIVCTPLPPSAELCDGLDNDCDGLTDEDFGVGQACDGAGVCGAGVVECLGPGGSICSSGAGGSADESDPETCDGLDNDCDGQTDEPDAGCFCSPGAIQACGATERGECVMGIQTCDPSGTWGPCAGAVEPVPELCDGLDNDCDGQTDEAFGVGEVCFSGGSCGSGVLECSGAFAARCSTGPGASADASSLEICDGIDNDCDGETDETVCRPCAPGDTRSCGTSVGLCGPGAWTCAGDGRSGTCSAVPPEKELCDGLDNDCDGQTDEEYGPGEPCVAAGVCGAGVLECDGLGGGRCSTEPGGSQDGSSPEACGNGLDDDCDGFIDELCPCAPSTTQPCGPATGICVPGIQTCGSGGFWGTECAGEVRPVPESCANPGEDNDCDGILDNIDDLSTSCGVGECASTGTCAGGADTCTPGMPSPEICDGLDNDCDGDTDEDFGVGLGCDGLGTCGSGVVECLDPSTVRCSSDAGGTRDESEAEVCDGLDNDCDGATDEGCACADGAVQSCGLTAGACVSGTQTCTGGSWGACTAVDPVAETCNGVDDDCDGETDEGYRIGESCVDTGACGGGLRECAGPNSVRCSTAPGGSHDLSSPEICDGLDNDCDGTTDEAEAGCSCAPPSTQACGVGLGICTSGTQTCGTSSGTWGVCTGSEPAQELCDGLDNDCDGLVDEDLTVSFCGIGACRAAAICTGGVPACLPLAPSAETCDGVDDDCDGFTDEEFGIGQSCDGAGQCGTGTRECDGPGAWRCSTEPGGSRDQSAPETCDGLDNDCDGQSDEGASCFAQGSACDADADCLGGLCRDGFCCDTACAGSCTSCGIAGSEGTCSPHAPGTDPDGDCGGFLCDAAGSCTTSCAGNGDCASGHYCSGAICVPQEPPGGACTPTGGECQPGLFCTPEGTCCTSSSCGPGETCAGGACEPSPYEPPYTSPARAGYGGTDEWPDRYLPADVYLHSGEVHHTATDLRIRGRGLDFVWTRKYRSRVGPDTAMGNGWDHNYNIRIEPFGANILLHDGQTREDLFFLQPDGSWGRDGFYSRLAVDPNGVYTLTFPDTSRWIFNPLDAAPEAGKISAIEDRNGNAVSFDYDLSGRMVIATDTLGRSITVAYDPNTSLITSVTDFAGRSVTYQYYQDGDAGGSAGDLKSVTGPAVTGTPNGNDFPSGKTTVYTYTTGFGDERLNHNLLTVTDPKGQTWLANSYASTTNPADPDFDRLVGRVQGDPGDILDFAYVPQVPDPNNGFAVIRSIVNDRVGNVTEYFYDTFNRIVLHRDHTGRADPDLPTSDTFNRPAGKLRASDPNFFETRFTYNDDAALTLLEHPNGNSTQYVYELDLDPNAPRRLRGNVREIQRLPGPLGGDQVQIDELFTYDPGPGAIGTNWVATHTDGRGNATSHSHDARGNRTQTVHRIPAIVEDFQYNAFGQMTGHDWPDDGSGHRRRDTWAYYATGPQTGYLESRVIDPNGFALTTTYEYDQVGNLIREIDPRGNDTLTTVNALDQAVRVESRPVSTPGGPVRYRRDLFYDENDNLIRIDVENRDDQGLLQPNAELTTTYEYDLLDYRTRVIREVDPNHDIVTEFEYDDNRNRTLIRKGEAVSGGAPGNTIRLLYDERDLLYREILGQGTPEQSTTQVDYDGNKNRTAVRQGLEGTPRITTFAYDGYDRSVSSTDPMGNVRLYTYDGNSNRLTARLDGELVDFAGGAGNVRLLETTYVYDPMDRRTLSVISFFDTATQVPIDDGLVSTQTAWTDASQVFSITDDNSNVTSFTYDTASRLLSATDPKGNTVTRSYDGNSNVLTATEVDKSDLLLPDELFVTTYAYDALDRMVLVADNLSNTDTFAYDSRGNRVLHIDARGNETRTVYDGADRPISTVHQLTDTGDGGGLVIGSITLLRSFDDSHRQTSTTDDNGNVTGYVHDSLDRLTTVSMADGTTSSRAYDVHHNTLTRTDANGSVITSAYDLLDRPVSVSISRAPGVVGTTAESYLYDGASRVVSAQDDDSLVTRSHDSLSRATSETQQVLPAGPAQSVTSTFDGVGRLTDVTYPGGRSLVLSYDALDRITLIEEAPAGAGPDVAALQYIGPYRIERIDYGNGVRYEPAYDGVRRLGSTRHVQSATGMPVDDRLYQWDAAHNKIEEQNRLVSPPEQRFYAIDSVDRLRGSQVVTSVPDPPIDYLLDGVNNRTSVSGGPAPGPYFLDPNVPPGDFQANQYTDTPFDSRLHDDNGNLVQTSSATGPTIQMTYDYRNQMVQHTNVSTSATVTSAYDCFGRRIQENDGSAVTTFLYLGGAEIEEQDAFGSTLATFVPGVGNQPVLHMIRGPQEHFFHADDLGSIRVLTDPNGSVAESYAYSDYGTPSILDATGAPLGFSAAGNPFLYRGFRFEEGTGLHIMIGRGSSFGGGHWGLSSLGSGGGGGSTAPFAGGAGGGPLTLRLDSEAGRTTSRGSSTTTTHTHYLIDETPTSESGSLGNALTFAGNNPVSGPSSSHSVSLPALGSSGVRGFLWRDPIGNSGDPAEYAVDVTPFDVNLSYGDLLTWSISSASALYGSAGRRGSELGSGGTAPGIAGPLGAGTTYRPPTVTPKPVVKGPQTAAVAGHDGEEIWTDEYGRVKVQFHWDRDGKNDDSASCWIRVAQSWAGATWGSFILPEVEDEVVVGFQRGDPEQPLVTGTLYQASLLPPYALPFSSCIAPACGRDTSPPPEIVIPPLDPVCGPDAKIHGPGCSATCHGHDVPIRCATLPCPPSTLRMGYCDDGTYIPSIKVWDWRSSDPLQR